MPSSAEQLGIAIQTPLAPDALFLTRFNGSEGLSQLFHFHLELMAENRTNIPFDKLIGQKITFSIILPDGKTKRFWSGICNSMAQQDRDSTFTNYRMEVVPKLWLLTRRRQSRIFQHMSVPDILKKVLADIDHKLELQGTFEPRDYCVQYRESDFDFASRLMEEEGIYYFFRHADGSHPMVVANSPKTHPDVPFIPNAIYEEVKGGVRPDMRIHHWEKNQELRSGKVTLWDHCFELPHQKLDAERTTPEVVDIGKVSHKLKLPANEPLELYDYPGGYAGRFDGVDRGGGDQAGNLNKIFQDNKRTVAIRMEQEAAQAIIIRGAGNCRQFMAGHKFTLERHFNADGPYVLASVQHNAAASTDFSSGGTSEITYVNSFTCLPLSLAFRPPRTTPRPEISGPQTATVVGPPGEEIYTDKYSRVKVQFPWDRQGKNNADSSCWIRVATIWAGKGYGVIHIPRIGQEVVVDFMEGDPDQPIIIGSVYNAENMPAAKLPDNKMVSGLKSANYPGGGGFNGMVANDTKGKQKLSVHAQFDMDTKVEHNDDQHVVNDRTIAVDGTHTETIDKDTTITIKTGNLSHEVKAGTALYKVKGAVTENFDDSHETIVKNGIHIASQTAHIYIHTATSIQLHVGDSNIWMDSGGQISIKGNNIAINGKESVTISGGMIRSVADSTHEIEGANVKSEGKGTNTVKGGMVMLNP